MITAAARPVVITATALAAVAGFVLLRLFDPNAPGSLFPPCIFRSITGLLCPGCGLTRMLHALAHGDLQRAVRMNAMLMAMLPALALMAANEFGPRRFLRGAAARWLYNPWGWLVVTVAFGVLRNLPWAPFTSLAPA
ncbi:DUF2752 domain-containing protein [Lysobacter sp. N42]|uniref:DUF2752 domain-containing protein n=1 Tax=Lysobacter sp. N42 TaxID=2545719 RepID=UPI001FB752FE|nr:DUF2752 domain-containing protein [Lysobacter sp. N42]